MAIIKFHSEIGDFVSTNACFEVIFRPNRIDYPLNHFKVIFSYGPDSNMVCPNRNKYFVCRVISIEHTQVPRILKSFLGEKHNQNLKIHSCENLGEFTEFPLVLDIESLY